jgi:hypothetical protein
MRWYASWKPCSSPRPTPRPPAKGFLYPQASIEAFFDLPAREHAEASRYLLARPREKSPGRFLACVAGVDPTRSRSRALAKLAAWSRLPTGTPDAVEQLRQQLQAFDINLEDRRAVRLAQRALAAAAELHQGIGDDREYVKRARLYYALARLCAHVETAMADEIEHSAPQADSAPPPRPASLD